MESDRPTWDHDAERIVDVESLGSELHDVVQHRLQHLGGMSFPRLHLTDDQQRMSGPVRLRDVAGELLVRDVGVVLERTGRFDHIDATPFVTACERSGQLRAPDRGLHQRREVDVVRGSAVVVVGTMAGHELIADLELPLRPVEERSFDVLTSVECHGDVAVGSCVHDAELIAFRAASSTSTPCARADASQPASSGVDPHR